MYKKKPVRHSFISSKSLDNLENISGNLVFDQNVKEESKSHPLNRGLLPSENLLYVSSRLRNIIKQKLKATWSQDRQLDNLILSLVSDRRPYQIGDAARTVDINRETTLGFLERTFLNYTQDQLKVSELGPVKLEEMTLPFEITHNNTQDHFNFRVGVILQPMNPFLYSQLVTQFYSGIVDTVSNDFYGYNLKGAYTQDRGQYEPPGIVSKHMLGLLNTYLSLSSPRLLIPDIATMALVRINGTTRLEYEPSLVFYIDVPLELYSQAILSLSNIMLQITKGVDSITYDIFSFIVPCLAHSAKVSSHRGDVNSGQTALIEMQHSNVQHFQHAASVGFQL